MIRIIAILALAAALSGCVAVVAGGAAAGAAVHDRRTTGNVIDDQNIELSAYDTLNRDKELALKNNVEIVVYNGVMLLIGQVRSAELRDRAERTVGGFQGVKRVVNQIEIGESPGFWSGTGDKVVTSRVKTGLLDIQDMPGFDPTRVNVTTENDVVYLMGLVSRAEAERVVQITRTTPGVERVVKVFEYTD
jgi:osmotically-inducible protein OsmY